ncbi:MAG: hypothetical protein L0332_07350 [Chloroflexi bacterium]|nr:hypothetical protein [Chloroflexota bacterium]MCI0579151.1 hypothetical protein [Chloroflexota bacterium]MCI0643661.1 hypothetical protein [Chloroflexota bacterium]MCI0726525.1 hypothetical protein [Chloroflexota bacterium]
MFIGVYLCMSGLVYWLGVAALASTRRHFALYSLLSFVLVLGAMAAFIGLSAVTDLMPVGGAGSWSYPGDYLVHGPVGWAIMLLPLVGLVAPLLAGLWLERRNRENGLHQPAA